MLDAAAAPGAPRSAQEAIAGALEFNMVYTKQEWLGRGAARQCAREFAEAFQNGPCTILTNRMDFGWNPVSDAAIEWAFAGFDDSHFALILVTAAD